MRVGRYVLLFAALLSACLLQVTPAWADTPLGRVATIEPLPPVDAQNESSTTEIFSNVSQGVPPQETGPQANSELITNVNLLQETMPPADAGPDAGSNLIDQGRSSFMTYCVNCHDAQRSLSKTKSYSAWLATVQRMANNEGADIPPSEFEPIAAYLASEAGGGGGSGIGSGDTSIFGTVSAIWRTGNTSANGNAPPPPPDPPDGLQDTGFFPDVWLGIQWKGGPVTARAQVCTSCHNPAQEGMNFELVDATVALDLMHAIHGECYDGILKAEMEAGRFIVPFGAYAGMSHPGVYRTMTNPLMFLMGRTVGAGFNRPVLPQPYSDEGFKLHAGVPITSEINATVDVYAVNGLQVGTTPFNNSRSYTDNNNDPAVGGRATLGSSNLRFGGSIMAGHLNDDLLATQSYKIYGADVVYHHQDFFRAYFEYALRSSDELGPQLRSQTYGTVAEVEAYVFERASLLARYDTLDTRGALGVFDTGRFTWGVNFQLAGGSEFIINHERWRVTSGEQVDVVGFRWFASF